MHVQNRMGHGGIEFDTYEFGSVAVFEKVDEYPIIWAVHVYAQKIKRFRKLRDVLLEYVRQQIGRMRLARNVAL